MTDEIICSVCGRPNLPEAEKCWYCQNPLAESPQNEQSSAEGKSTTTDEIILTESKISKETQNKQGEEAIPDWLKRVRELIKENQPKEEEEEEWRQQILFSSLEQSKPTKPKRMPKERLSTKPPPKKTPANLEPDSPQSLDQSPSEKLPSPTGEFPQKEEEPPIGDEQELPEGFTPLDTKEE